MNFEHIGNLTAEFQEMEGMAAGGRAGDLTPETASYWQLRILLAIAQQLSVIAGEIKKQK